MITYTTFTDAKRLLTEDFVRRSYEVAAPRWQGVDVSSKPEMRMRELLNISFQVPLRGIEDPEHWQKDTGCNFPFADVHFAERVGGQPTNPGEAWKIWPWGNSASKFLEVDGKQFSHTYQERLWPKMANAENLGDLRPLQGIRYLYADLNDLVDHLAKDPLSRQAYVPLWFPEDGTCPGRKPCTLGWHFILRHDYLHHNYFIRSCDFVRHFADDCYLAIRLHLWVLDRLREKDDRWKDVKPGLFSMHIVSLHCFINDWRQMKNGKLSP